MNTIRTISGVLKMAFLCAGLVLAAAGAHAQGPSDTADTAEALRPLDLAKIWLLEDCGLNTYPFAKVFVDSRAEIVPVLIRAFDDGPPEDLRASTRQSAQLAFERRQAWLRDSPPQWLDEASLHAIRSATNDESVQQALSTLDAKYRQQALNGLALAGGDEANAVLDRVAKSDSPFSSTAASLRGLAPRSSTR